MTATIQIHEKTSATEGVDKTNGSVRFKSANETTVDDTNRIRIPESGQAFSFSKNLQLYMSVAPDYDITNIQVYPGETSNGMNENGVSVQYKVNGTFTTPSNSSIAGTDLSTVTEASPISLGSGPFTSTGYIGDHLLLQLIVANTATSGLKGGWELTFSYDEA